MRYYIPQKRPGIMGKWSNKNEGNMREKTVSVNGTVYDTKTGKPVRLERSAHPAPRKASVVHSRAQHSRTLNRRYVKKAVSTSEAAPAVHTIEVKRKTHVAKPDTTHKSVTRFAADITPAKATPKTTRATLDIALVSHPIAQKAVKKHAQLANAPKHSAPAPKPSDILKKEAIAQATDKMTPRSKKKDVKAKKFASKRARRLNLAAAGMAFMLFSGYLTYLYMPNLSTKVAASQAGIDAQYPAYQPSGYRLSGPIAYQPGEVSMKFAANAGPATYTLTQKRSAWDSSAVYENYVEPKAAKDFSTTQANGLTIYSYGSNSAWVNGGILYTLEGDAPLSSEQVQRIARSL